MLENTWAYGVDPTTQPRYQLVVDCTYWPVFGSFNNWNIIQFSNRKISSKEFYAVHTVVLDGLSENTAYLVQPGKCGNINAADLTTMDCYVIKYLSEPYTLKEDQTTDVQLSKPGENLVKAEYLSTTKSKNT